MLIGEGKDIDSDELAELGEDGDNIFICGWNLSVLLKATVLKKAVEGFGLWHRLFTNAMEQGKHPESQRVYLVLSVTLGLKLRWCKHLAQCATPVEQISPGICRQGRAQGLQGDVRLDIIAAIASIVGQSCCFSLINLRHHLLNLDAIERKWLFKSLVEVLNALPLDDRQILDLIRLCLVHLHDTFHTFDNWEATHRSFFAFTANAHLFQI